MKNIAVPAATLNCVPHRYVRPILFTAYWRSTDAMQIFGEFGGQRSSSQKMIMKEGVSSPLNPVKVKFSKKVRRAVKILAVYAGDKFNVGGCRTQYYPDVRRSCGPPG